LDLHTLHERTGIDKRKLRYCVDHKLIPELNIELAVDEAGRPRRFADDVGFAIVCAARLLEIGLAHEIIRSFLQGLLAITVEKHGPSTRALVAILEQSLPAVVEFGDGGNIRLTVEAILYDSGWRRMGTSEILKGYTPTVSIKLDLGKIWKLIQGQENV